MFNNNPFFTQIFNIYFGTINQILKTAKKIGKPVPIKKGSKNQKAFSKMIHMECLLEAIGLVKLMVGIKKKTGEKIQYCLTAIEQEQ